MLDGVWPATRSGADCGSAVLFGYHARGAGVAEEVARLRGGKWLRGCWGQLLGFPPWTAATSKTRRLDESEARTLFKQTPSRSPYSARFTVLMQADPRKEKSRAFDGGSWPLHHGSWPLSQPSKEGEGGVMIGTLKTNDVSPPEGGLKGNQWLNRHAAIFLSGRVGR